MNNFMKGIKLSIKLNVIIENIQKRVAFLAPYTNTNTLIQYNRYLNGIIVYMCDKG